MADQVGICNRALVAELGARPIVSIDEDSDGARACKAEYQSLVDELLEQHDWRFASVHVGPLAPLLPPDAPLWDFAFAFEVPVDCLRIRETSLDEALGGCGGRWAREGNRLLADVDAISLRYTARVTEGTWSAAFATAVALGLSARIAYAITGKENKATAQEQKAARALAYAKSVAGYMGSPRPVMSSTLIRVRW